MEYKVDYNAKSVMQQFLDDNPNDALDMSYDAMAEISLAFSDYRRDNRLSQADMAEKLGVSQPMISKIESGEYNFTIELLCTICEKIGWKFSVDLRQNEFKYVFRKSTEYCVKKILDPEIRSAKRRQAKEFEVA